jgi:hypothetical protein
VSLLATTRSRWKRYRTDPLYSAARGESSSACTSQRLSRASTDALTCSYSYVLGHEGKQLVCALLQRMHKLTAHPAPLSTPFLATVQL